MRTIRVGAEGLDPAALAEAVVLLEEGGVVAFPTETVYGLCADASNEEAVARLYAVKGRAADQSCSFLLEDRKAVARHVEELPPLAERLADAFWPGPLTLVVPRTDGGGVGLRLPAHPVARALARVAGRPLLQTSANRSGEEPARDGAGVERALGPSVDLLLDAGPVLGGRPSTVVRCDAKRCTVLRTGAIREDQIAEAASRLYLAACTGNLCRSPVAEAMLKKLLAERLGCAEQDLALHGFRFGSFGVLGLDDHPASENAVLAAGELGYDVTAHRSRPFSIAMAGSAHRVYWLDRNHRNFLLPYFQDRAEDLQPLDPAGKEIADPFGRSLRFNRKIAAAIEKACRARAQELVPDEEETTE